MCIIPLMVASIGMGRISGSFIIRIWSDIKHGTRPDLIFGVRPTHRSNVRHKAKYLTGCTWHPVGWMSGNGSNIRLI